LGTKGQLEPIQLSFNFNQFSFLFPCITEDKKPFKQIKEEKEAISRLVSDLPEDEEDYLNISLDEERQFLCEYQSLIFSLKP